MYIVTRGRCRVFWTWPPNVACRCASIHRSATFQGSMGNGAARPISGKSLARASGDCTKLSCRPGYAEPDYPGSYCVERETELRTLCDPVIRDVLAAHSIQLISYHDLDKLAVGLANRGAS